jgi:phosphonate transport system substrate-binding protein
MVRKDSEIETLEDLRGKKIAGISTVSLAGYLFLRNDLADLGLYPREDYQIDFYGRSESIPFMISSGTVDAGVFSEDTLVRSSILGTIRDNLKIIHRSIPIPQFPLAVSSDFDPRLVEKIQAALGGFSADDTELGRSLTELNLTGLEAVTDEDYEPFRRLYWKVRDYSLERVEE